MKIHSRARPIRIAYLVEDNEYSSLVLDAIYEASFGIWGGRFNLIIPCADGKPLPSFMLWLKVYDPDIIYSYCDLNTECVEELHEIVYPSYLTLHESSQTKEITAWSFRPRHKLSPLSIETLIPYARLPSLGTNSTLPLLAECYFGRAGHDQFLQFNFGSFTSSTGGSLPGQLQEFCQPIHVLADDELQPRQRHGIQNYVTVQDRISLLTEASNRKLLSVARLSCTDVPRLEIRNSNWANSFNIVVGSNFVDRVTFWNARSLYPRWRDWQDVDLYIPQHDIEDGNLINAIQEFIRRRNDVSFDQNNGTKQATIRSSSVSTSRLETLAKTLKGDSGWIQFDVKAIESIADHVPAVKKLEESQFLNFDGIGSATLSSWTSHISADDHIEFSPSRPSHLDHSPTHLLGRSGGAWAVDLLIPGQLDYSKYGNVQQNWILPKRLRLASAFKSAYQINGRGALAYPRVSSGGHLCIYADVKSKSENIAIPSDLYAVSSALTHGLDWYPFKHESSQETLSAAPPQRAYAVERSAAGKYFWGVVNQFGGLADASEFLLHTFWNEQLKALGAWTKKEAQFKSEIADILRKRLKSKLGHTVGENIDVIADRVFETAETLKGGPHSVSWSTLQKAHSEFIRVKIEKELIGRDPEIIEEEIAGDVKTLEPSLQRLCAKGVFYQGYETKCPTCLHKFWVSISALSLRTTCEVCANVFAAPTSQSWDFRLNDFVKEALRAHGMLPMFWALKKSRAFSENSFYFEGPIDIYFSKEKYENHKRDTDIDLTTVTNGIVQMFEVKQSARHIQVTRFADVAKKLRPDIATIAIMEPISKEINRQFTQFQKCLEGTGIEPRLITADLDNDFSNNTWLC